MKQKNDLMSLVESRFYCCFRCRTVLALQDDIVSKTFVAGRRGRAFLFSRVKNVVEGPAADRSLITGAHMISVVYCSDCGEDLGWKYVKVYQQRHLFKLGKIVLIKSKIATLANNPLPL